MAAMGNTLPKKATDFEALLFDLDGTLIDSEGRTEAVVGALFAAEGIELASLGDLSRFHGATWRRIAEEMIAAFPGLRPSARGLSDELQRDFQASLVAEPPPLVPGARDALEGALAAGHAGIVTSTTRESLDHALTLLAVDPKRLVQVCAEDVSASKPAPEGFFLAASRLGVDPSRCLVFEDSVAGLTAARAAGMYRVAIARDRDFAEREALRRLASTVISDYRELPAGFFSSTALESGP